MDATDSKASVVIKVHNTVNETTSHSCLSEQEIPLATSPSILLHVLSSYGLEPKDLAALEATCTFYRSEANFEPDATLSLPEVAAYDTCCQKAMFKSMKHEEKERLKQRCGGSWKLILMYLLIGEKNYHRGKSQVVAGPGHSVAVTPKGDVYSFGANSSGQLGLGNTEEQFEPCLIRSLQGIRIIQAAVGSRRTMLVSDTGSVYAFGQDSFASLESAGAYTSSPKAVESLKGIFVVQASIGGHFSAVLSREGQVYTFCWGRDERLGHRSDPTDLEPRLLSGLLEDALVVQIAAGNCFLLMLAYQPTGMSVYSVGCGKGGKLGHWYGTKNLTIPKMIQHFQTPKVKPVSVSAGAFHCAVLAGDGRVFTWGRNYYGCLGHDYEDEYTILPTAVESLVSVKATYSLCPVETVVLRPCANTKKRSSCQKDSMGKVQQQVTSGGELSTRLARPFYSRERTREQGTSGPELFSSFITGAAVLLELWTTVSVGQHLNSPTTDSLGQREYVSTGYHSTFVIADNGNVYSFGCNLSDNLGLQEDGVEDDSDDEIPKLATRIVALDQKVVQISATNTWDWVDHSKTSDRSHTLVLTESGSVYSLGAGSRGQLGVKLTKGHKTRLDPHRVDIDLA